MIEPVATTDLMTSVIAAALVILGGGGYALGYAWARLWRRPAVLVGAYAAFAVLVVAVWALARTAHLDGHWRHLSALMLLGYFLLPRVVFRLCTGTHAASSSERRPNESSRMEDTP